ncbi:MAG TPA: efflux RND transporter periplasmic adaptor subunit [Bryobacteraceae bacterium]|nr:efflux RND transporter periplasmic adaptor subunit [Bryobacteraceae bacterium]
MASPIVESSRACMALLLLLPAAVTVVSCGNSAGSAKSDATDVPTIAVAKAEKANLTHNLTLTGEFKPYQEIDVMAKVAGYVRQINVDIGDRVRQGQLLATLEVPEMADEINKAKAEIERSQAQVVQAQDEVHRAESNYQIAHLTFTRLDGVLKNRPGLVAQQEVDDAQARDNTASAQVSAAKSNVAAAQHQVAVAQAEMARIQTLFGYTKVIAPFDGVITRRFADTGSMIQAGTSSQTQAMPVVRLSQNNLLRLILPVPESATPTVHIGQQVDVRAPTLNRTFPGKVVRFADKLSLETRTMDTEVDVPNPTLTLIPGMYAEVDLTLKRENDALSVPVTAVDVDPDNEHAGKVMVVDSGDRLQNRPVTLGMQTANRIEVQSGLTSGDLVVIGSRAGLQGGARVKPKVAVLSAEANP